MKLKDMTSAKWKQLKGDAGVMKTKWFKLGHVSVGKYIEKLNSARADWNSSKTDEYGKSMNAFREYVKALTNLEKALTKFLKSKEFGESDEAAQLQKEIGGWLVEIQQKLGKLAAALPATKKEMEANDAKRLIDRLDGMM